MTASLAPLWQWLSATAVARAVHDSQMLTAVLSAFHVLGMTILTGAVLVSGLRLSGLLFGDVDVRDVTRATRRGVDVGLAISVVTGLLLFAPRAADAAANTIFQFKMTVLLVAAVCHVTVFRRVTTRPAAGRTVGVLTMLLWLGVAAGGAAYILLEGV